MTDRRLKISCVKEWVVQENNQCVSCDDIHSWVDGLEIEVGGNPVLFFSYPYNVVIRDKIVEVSNDDNTVRFHLSDTSMTIEQFKKFISDCHCCGTSELIIHGEYVDQQAAAADNVPVDGLFRASFGSTAYPEGVLVQNKL